MCDSCLLFISLMIISPTFPIHILWCLFEHRSCVQKTYWDYRSSVNWNPTQDVSHTANWTWSSNDYCNTLSTKTLLHYLLTEFSVPLNFCKRTLQLNLNNYPSFFNTATRKHPHHGIIAQNIHARNPLMNLGHENLCKNISYPLQKLSPYTHYLQIYHHHIQTLNHLSGAKLNNTNQTNLANYQYDKFASLNQILLLQIFTSTCEQYHS